MASSYWCKLLARLVLARFPINVQGWSYWEFKFADASKLKLAMQWRKTICIQMMKVELKFWKANLDVPTKLLSWKKRKKVSFEKKLVCQPWPNIMRILFKLLIACVSFGVPYCLLLFPSYNLLTQKQYQKDILYWRG